MVTSTTIRLMLNALLVPLFGLSVYGYWADFIPSQKWMDAATYISSMLTLLSCGVFYWTILTGKYQLQTGVSQGKKALYLLAFPIIVFILFRFSITHGVADVATIFTGNKRMENVVLEKKFVSSRRACRYRLTGDYMKNANPSYLCVNADVFESLPEKAIYHLQISETFLGTHIAHFNLPEHRW